MSSIYPMEEIIYRVARDRILDHGAHLLTHTMVEEKAEQSTSKEEKGKVEIQMDNIKRVADHQEKDIQEEIVFLRWAILYYVIATVSFSIASLAFVYGLAEGLTYGWNISYIVVMTIGIILYVPAAWVCRKAFFPSREIIEKREELRRKRQLRKESEVLQAYLEVSKTSRYANAAVVPAHVDASVFPMDITVTAVIRGSQGRPSRHIPCSVTYLYQLCQAVEAMSGLPIEQQFIKFNNRVLIRYESHLEKDFGIKDNDTVHVFNRGKYLSAFDAKKRLDEHNQVVAALKAAEVKDAVFSC